MLDQFFGGAIYTQVSPFSSFVVLRQIQRDVFVAIILLKYILKEDVDHYRSVFPDGVQLLQSHSSQYAGEDSRVRSAILNCVSNMSHEERDKDDALVMFDQFWNCRLLADVGEVVMSYGGLYQACARDR